MRRSRHASRALCQRSGLKPLVPLAVALWVLTLVLLATADWSLTCTSGNGLYLTGIDCLDSAVPTASSMPARWVGFVPLAATWCVASGFLLAYGLRYMRHGRT